MGLIIYTLQQVLQDESKKSMYSKVLPFPWKMYMSKSLQYWSSDHQSQ